MGNLTEEEKKKIMQELRKKLDVDSDGEISDEELEEVKKIYSDELHNRDPNISKLLKEFDTDGDGKLDLNELQAMKKELNLMEGTQRYAGYSVAFSRAFRYLAFTSDFGEALRPVLAARIVTGTYAIAISYCFVDVGWEAYKLHKRGYVTQKNEPMTMTQCVVERSMFQAIASIIVPAVTIHTTVDVSKHLFKRIGRFQKWGPSIVGLSVIPFLPLYLDHPVESGLEWLLKHYGPWAKKSHQD